MLLSVLCALSYGNLSAQVEFKEGYIITLQSDTVKGWVRDSPTGIDEGKCEFKARADAMPRIFSPGAVSGFGFTTEDRYYQTLEVLSEENERELIFAEQLLRGRANLFFYNDHFYLQKDDKVEKIGKVKVRETSAENGRFLHQHKIYIGTLNRYFSDCIPQKLLQGNIAYTEKDFVDVFKKYSECSEADYYQYKNRKEKRRTRFQVFAGINNSSIRFQDPDLDIYRRDNNFFLGAGVAVPVSFLCDKCYLTAEPAYHRNVYRGLRSGFTPTGDVDKDYILNLSTVRVPVGLKFELGSSGVVPYVRAGLTALVPLKGELRIERSGVTESQFDIDEKTASLIYWGSFGMQFRLTPSKQLFAELRAEKFIDYIGFYGPQGATNIPSSVFNKMFILGLNF